ncbi:transcription factor Dp-1 [Enteropsectra breve]|nr:transcription factor Dp-1 [Enteropsectra breve]
MAEFLDRSAQKRLFSNNAPLAKICGSFRCPMDMVSSEMPASEGKREGMKHITQEVYSVIKKYKECTYQIICTEVTAHNSETANRRIYDILNVMRAVNIIGKREKYYYLIDNSDDLRRKKNEKKRLIEMRDVFKFITTRNKLLYNENSEKLYLPFMVISTDKKSEINCDTNEERSFFLFKSNKPLKVNEDLSILKSIRDQSNENSKMLGHNLAFDNFIL